MISPHTFFKPLTYVPSGTSCNGKIHEISNPDSVAIPLEYPEQVLYMPEVREGEHVRKNQIIGRSKLGNCVHASISGVVKEIKTIWTARSYHVPAIVISKDGDLPLDGNEIVKKSGSRRDITSWVDRLKMSGVVCPWTLPGRFHHEESPEGLPEVDTVVIKGVNEEPTVFTFETLLRIETENIKRGMDLLGGVAPKARIILTVPKRLSSWASKEFGDKARVVALSDDYKERIERFSIPRITNKSIPNTIAYRRKGVAVLSVEYLLTMLDALEGNGPFTEKYVTIAGDSLSKAVVVRFPIGTSIRTILHDLGLDNVPYARLLVGGPMKGNAQFTDETPLTKSVHGIYLVSEENVPPDINLPCINCGRCTRACPANIQVHLLGRYIEHNLFLDTSKFHPEACNECGLCAYVCPAHRPLVQMIKLCNQYEG